ncbi:MAG: hypothetical protein HC933_14810, partial [Pleurocapsa sp. SU_196_0]|nr:hypothetical protein [Pleurocapsa sp. SU_196_0]
MQPVANQGRETLKLIYIIGSYPLLTTTFIDREIQLLRQWGNELKIIAIRRPTGQLSEEQLALQKAVLYLLPVHWLGLFVGQFAFSRATASRLYGHIALFVDPPPPQPESVAD